MKVVSLFFVLLAFPLWSKPMIWLTDASPGLQKTITLDGQTRDLILQGMDELSFQVERIHPKRGLKRLEQEDNICMDDKLYTAEREAFSLASALPQVVLPDLRLYIRGETPLLEQIEALADDDKLDLAQLLNNIPRFRLGLMEGRAYGDRLDVILSQPGWQRQIWRRPGADMGSGVIDMLINERVDGIIEYPIVFQHESGMTASSQRVKSYRLTQTSHYTQGYVLCSRSEQGQQAIDAISIRIAKLAKTRAYLDAHLQWFDESVHAELTQYYNQVYGTDFDGTGDR